MDLWGRLRSIEDIAELKSFDCGDRELNRFLKEDAHLFKDQMIANTYVWEDSVSTIAYFCLLSDKVSQDVIDKNLWRKLRKSLPHGKHFNSYPAVKIGRLAVSVKQSGKGLGSKIISMIKYILLRNQHIAAMRFITVDAYIEVVPFYTNNGFKPLRNEPINKVLPMYFDLLQFQLSE